MENQPPQLVSIETPQFADKEPSLTSTDWPVVTIFYSIACIGIYLGFILANDYGNQATLSHFGYYSATQIWDGSYWGLISSAAVHFEWWHVAFNLYWLWVLGGCMERTIGRGKYLGLIVTAAAVSSSYQLAVSDTTGIGASGVVYAIFGFMSFNRDRYREFQRVLPWKTIRLLNSWLLFCFLLTQLGIMQIGNAAHLTGLLFGAGVGRIATQSRGWKLTVTGLAGLFIGAIVPLFWSPWSITWQGHQGYRAQLDERYEDALWYYNSVIERDPETSWAYYNRSIVHAALMNSAQSVADRRKAMELDPAVEEQSPTPE